MEEASMKQLKNKKKRHTLLIDIIVLISGALGFFLYEVGGLNSILSLRVVQEFFQTICDINELWIALGIFPITIVEKWVEHTMTRKEPNSNKWKVITLALTLICIFSSMMLGISVAKKSAEQMELQAIINEVNGSDLEEDPIKEYDIEKYEEFDNYNCVEIKVSTFSDKPYENITIYRLDRIEKIGAFSRMYKILNPFSSFVTQIRGVDYAKYEMNFTALDVKPPVCPPTETSIIGTDKTTLTEPETVNTTQETLTSSNDVLVIIEEVLVKKDGEPLIKTKEEPGISRNISYGYFEDELITEKIKSSERGYTIHSDQSEINFVSWNENIKPVNEKNEVYFEDSYMDKNTPFNLSVENLKELFNKSNIDYCDGNLNVTMYEINCLNDPVYVSLPLDMTTEVCRILYHYRDEKNDRYFTVQTAPNGHELIFEDKANRSDYKLLCEIAVE